MRNESLFIVRHSNHLHDVVSGFLMPFLEQLQQTHDQEARSRALLNCRKYWCRVQV
jgi:hypothetical protein